MRSRVVACAVMMLGLAEAPVMAQTADTAMTAADEPVFAPAGPVVDTEPPVIQYDISGPRIGVTFMPNGIGARSQFGWHHENMASPTSRGPWFLVQQIYLIGGVDQNEFIPSGTLMFGVRTPSSFEFGIGPSLTIFGPLGATTAVVAAVGQTLRYGGIRVPVNLAVAMSRNQGVGSYRVTLITGWAIKHPPEQGAREPYHQSRPLGNGGPGR